MMLLTRLHLAPRLRIQGGIPLFPHTSPWRGLSAHMLELTSTYWKYAKKFSFTICICSFVLQNQKVLLRLYKYSYRCNI
jgi:hypothetical protein